MPSSRYVYCFFVLAAGCLFLGGCGDGKPERVPVTGTVTLNGKPVEAATVRFIIKGGAAASGYTDAEGRFALSTFDAGDGARPGKAQVVISKATADYTARVTRYIPQRYEIPGQSGLDVDIVAGEENDFTFELTSP